MNQIPEEDSFKYTLLDERTRTIIRQHAAEIKNLMRLTAENIIDIGKRLTEVKERLEYGSFESWLKTEFEWSEQTARQFMQVYRWSETIENKNFVFSQLATSALYLLAAPSTPPEARAEVLSIVDGGEKVTYTRVRIIVERHKSAATLSPGDQTENNDSDSVIDVVAQSEVNQTTSEREFASNQLFRLTTQNLGCLVRLYRADELEATTEMTVGATVKIKVGRWHGQTATINEILTDRQTLMSEPEEIVPISSATPPKNATLQFKLSTRQICQS